MNQNELLLIQALVGQVLPPLTDIINKNVPNSKIRFLASILISAIIAIVFNYQQLMFGNLEQTLTSFLLIWTSSQAAYKLYYEGSKYQDQIRFNNSPIPLTKLIPPLPKIGK